MSTLYDEIGNEAFEQLVSHFYALVSINPVIAPMYPKDDIHGAALRLKMFLEQYWGGPNNVYRRTWAPTASHAPCRVSY